MPNTAKEKRNLLRIYNMAGVNLTVEPFIWDDNTSTLDWKKWLIKFENIFTLSRMDITQAAYAKLAVEHLIGHGDPQIFDIIVSLPQKL